MFVFEGEVVSTPPFFINTLYYIHTLTMGIIKTFEEFVNKTQQINLDEIDVISDVDLFDNGDANYYFTTDKPLHNNTATMQAFLEIVEDTDDKIEWTYDGSQAFAKKLDGTTIQLDAAGDGDFTHHLISVTTIK